MALKRQPADPACLVTVGRLDHSPPLRPRTDRLQPVHGITIRLLKKALCDMDTERRTQGGYGMAEIKSTFDLIMERTKNLTLSETEKEALQRKEWQEEIRGYLLKIRDGLIDTKDIQAPLHEKCSVHSDYRDLLLQALLDEINLEGNNAPWLRLLEKPLTLSIRPLVHLIDRQEKETERDRSSCEAIWREDLARRGILGSAILWNPQSDPRWQSRMTDRRDAFHKTLRDLYK